jgi:hypothetical protein
MPVRRQEASDLLSFFLWEQNIVLGDSNLDKLQHPKTTVLARENGRLSHFLNLFRTVTQTFKHVTTIIISLSTLERSNSVITKTSTLKSLLGALHRVFPKARVYVLACGVDNSFSDEDKRSCSSLNNFICSKNPSSCVYIPAAEPFVCVGDTWDDATKEETYESIRKYLN